MQCDSQLVSDVDFPMPCDYLLISEDGSFMQISLPINWFLVVICPCNMAINWFPKMVCLCNAVTNIYKKSSLLMESDYLLVPEDGLAGLS